MRGGLVSIGPTIPKAIAANGGKHQDEMDQRWDAGRHSAGAEQRGKQKADTPAAVPPIDETSAGGCLYPVGFDIGGDVGVGQAEPENEERGKQARDPDGQGGQYKPAGKDR